MALSLAVVCGVANAQENDDLAALLRGMPKTTCTKRGTPGDPFNVAIVGSQQELVSAFCSAGWHLADPVNVRSSIGITLSTAFNIPYPEAPVSPLYVCGRQQTFAFEIACGNSVRKRHHVRFWCMARDAAGRQIWLGADTFDASVGISKATGKPTHHIDPDIDRERDFLINTLQRCDRLERTALVPHLEWRTGRNGENDCYFTDGNVAIGVLRRSAYEANLSTPAAVSP